MLRSLYLDFNRMMILHGKFPLFLFFCSSVFLHTLNSQTASVQDSVGALISRSLKLSVKDTVYQLPDEFIVRNSETVILESGRLLVREDEYSLDSRFGVLRIKPETLERIFSDSLSHTLSITYRALPLKFKKEYFLRQVVTRTDSSGARKTSISQPSQQFSVEDYFGSGLQKSGSIARGFSVGSNRDLSLTSGFRMQLAGKLSRDMDIVAALTDENSPIQPEGTTQTLREVDKVFIELKNPTYGATLGDFNTEIKENEGGEFARVFRKLQGVRGIASFQQGGLTTQEPNVSLTAATSRGKFQTNQFQGIEGSQGPYRLTGRNGESRLLVVAGSERVYVNGERMSRGETNDYTIDYASGEIIFMSRRLITNASRITVDFEYNDRQFIRNFISGSTHIVGLDGGLSLNAVFIQEADDADSPVDVPLDDASRDILRQSGDDRFKASLPGIRFVGRDTLTRAGLGQYILRDSTIGGKDYSILVYAPGDSLALYAASFSQVDHVPADSAGYIRAGIGQFRFAGVGAGNYLPIQFLPIPQLQRILDLNAKAALSRDLSISGEYAASFRDRNRLSLLDDRDQNGAAMRFNLQYNPQQVQFMGSNIGDLDINISERFVDRKFVAADRFNEIEFNRNWNLGVPGSTNEEIREASVAYKPDKRTSISAFYGLLDRPGEARAQRLRSEVTIDVQDLPRLAYRVEDITTSFPGNVTSSWLRQTGGIDHLLGDVQPGFGVEAEKRLSESNPDSLQQGSFRFLQLSPRIALMNLGPMSVSAEVQFRTEDSASGGSLKRAFNSVTQIYSWQLSEWSSFSSALNFSIRKTEFSDEFKAMGNSNSEVILVRSVSRYTPLQRALEADAFYEFSSQRSARLERAFVRVARGSGNYRYKGDLNGNGIADENEFELTRFDGDFVILYVPSDQLYPVVDLHTSVRIRLQPSRMISEGSGGFRKLLRAVSTETFARIDEKSSEPDIKQIYLLNFRKFQNEGTTISGLNQLTQDLFIFENSPDLSFRFRLTERSGLLQLVSANERSYQNERSVRIRAQLSGEIGSQTDYASKIDRVTSTGPSLRVRDLAIDALNSDVSYRPEPEWEVGLTLGISRIIDRLTVSNATADINEEGLRLVYGILRYGQVRAEIRREEVTFSNVTFDPAKPLPYEFTNGKVEGKSYLWKLAFDYRISQNVQVTLNYDGRSEGERSAVHTARAEAKAFF